MQEQGKINILLVDDKPEKILALAAVLEDLARMSFKPIPAARPCAVCSMRNLPSFCST